MAKRLVCCSSEDSFVYLYVDTAKLLVMDVTEELSLIDGNLRNRCSLDSFLDYARNDDVLPEEIRESIPFDFTGINSFEFFASGDELRLKTGSERVFKSCILNYYRREYDGTQEYAHFSDPIVNNTYVHLESDVEHELVLEEREFIKVEEEEFVPETLDKGKSDAEREAEAARLEAEAELQEALQKAEKEAEKKKKQKERRKKREKELEQERYRFIRESDDVRNAEYQHLKQMEEEMRLNNADLSSEYLQGNYSSLPGFISMDDYSQNYVNAGNECLEVPVSNGDLYSFASRLDEMAVPYSVKTDIYADGTAYSVVCYTSDYAEQGSQAIELYTLEQELIIDNVIKNSDYYSASQLCALKYAADNYIDTSSFSTGSFNGEQIYCLTEASLKGLDISVLANPDYSVAHMDAMAYFMENNWDIGCISDPSMPLSTVAECLNREEYANAIPKEISYFELHDYNSFVNYNNDWNAHFDESNFIDNRQEVNRVNTDRNSSDGEISLDDFKKRIHESYIGIQKEMNWIADDSVQLNKELNINGEIDRIPPNVLSQLQTEEGRRGSGWTVTNYGSDGVKGNTSFLLYNGLRFDMATGACVGGKINGFDMNVVPFNVLNDKQFKSMPKWNSGEDNDFKSYNFNAKYTPTGYNKSDNSYSDHKWFNKKEYQSNNSDRTNRASAGAVPTGSPAKDKKPFTQSPYPLDELKVRSSYANRLGLIVQNRGSQMLSSTVNMFKGPSFNTINSVLQMDESGTFSSYHKVKRVTGNVIFAAQIVSDVPRMFARVGQSVSYTQNAIANAGRWAVGKDTVKREFRPLTEKAMTQHINKVKEAHYNSIKTQYGAKAASMNIKDINRNIRALEKEMQPHISANKALKNDINKLDPNKKIRNYVKNQEDVKNLLSKNKSLKDEIRTLQYKRGKTAAEQARLNSLLEKKKANEKLIGNKKQAIKQTGKINRAKRDEILVKMAEKKRTEGKIKKIADKKNALVGLKKKQKGFQKKMANKNQTRKTFAKKKMRLKQIPSRLAYSFVSQLNKAGEDITMGGVARASSYAMSIARNPITNILTRSTIRIIKKPVIKIKDTGKRVIKNTNVYKKYTVKKEEFALKHKNARKDAFNNVKSKLSKKVDKTLGSKKAKKLKKYGKKGKNALSKANKARKKTQKAASKVFNFISTVFNKIASYISGLKTALLKVALYSALIVLILYLLLVVFALVADIFTSFIMVGDKTDDGRIDLAPYVEIVNEEKSILQDTISDYANGTNDAGKPYDNVFYDYNGKFDNNTLEILSMAYIRFDLDWETHKDDVKAYLKQLYADSNYVDAAASEPYFCANGCEERFYRCYNPYDEYATEERKTLYKRSDHSDETWIGESASAQKGCTKTKTYSCMEQGHGTYNKNGCRIHNNGEAMSKSCGCSNCKKVTTVKTYTNYYCQGYDTSGGKAYHNNGEAMSSPCSCLLCEKKTTSETIVKYYCQGYCTEKHYDYYCPGHKEVICKGEHQDLTITITTLGFDDIFYADTSFAENGAYIKGDAYDDKFTITAYCPCTKCCGSNATGTTASGVKAKANHTIAVDKKVIPLGTHVWIDGKEYVAEDTGSAIKGNRIDIFFNTHQEALNYGKRTKTVYKSETVVNDGIHNDKYDFDGWTEDNKEMARNIYTGLTDDEADEMYAGLDGIADLSYGSGTDTNIDWDSFEFDDSEGLTRNQQKVVAVIKSNQIAAKKGYCQAWVSNVYAAAIGKDESRCCANHAGEAWGVSNDWGDIQVGATVYGYNGGNNPYGHVGIYIGNGMVAHNIGYVKIDSLEYWVTRYDGRCWGWNGGANLTGKKEYNCKPSGTFMKGKD